MPQLKLCRSLQLLAAVIACTSYLGDGKISRLIALFAGFSFLSFFAKLTPEFRTARRQESAIVIIVIGPLFGALLHIMDLRHLPKPLSILLPRRIYQGADRLRAGLFLEVVGETPWAAWELLLADATIAILNILEFALLLTAPQAQIPPRQLIVPDSEPLVHPETISISFSRLLNTEQESQV